MNNSEDDTPWTTDQMRHNSSNWTLEGDAKLLLYLKAFSKNLCKRSKATKVKIDGMISTLDYTQVALGNSTNRFHALQHSQFVESRVYEEDIEVAAPKQEVSMPEEAKIDPAIIAKQAVLCGLKLMETEYVKVPLQNQDGIGDNARCRYLPKDRYSQRTFPPRIGSKEFLASLNPHSESDSEAGLGSSRSRSPSNASSQSKSYSPLPGSVSGKSETTTGVPKVPIDLFGQSSDEDEDYLSTNNHTNGKNLDTSSTRSSISYDKNPSPIKAYTPANDNSNSGYAPKPKPRENYPILFNEGPPIDITNQNDDQTNLFDDEEENLFDNKKSVTKPMGAKIFHDQVVSKPKVVNLFDDEPPEDNSSPINNKSNNSKGNNLFDEESDEDLFVENKIQEVKNNKSNDGKVLNRVRVFPDEPPEVSKSNLIANTKGAVKKNIEVKPKIGQVVEKSKTVDLFNDSDDDLFASPKIINKSNKKSDISKSKQNDEKSTISLFADDEDDIKIESNVFSKSTNKQKPVSFNLFEDEPPLDFGDVLSKQNKNKGKDTVDITKKLNLFSDSDDEDIFASLIKNEVPKKIPQKSNELFGEDSNNKVDNVKKEELKSKIDSEDSVLNVKNEVKLPTHDLSKNRREKLVTKLDTDSNLFNSNSKNSSQPKFVDLFEDEDDLFSTGPSIKKKITENKIQKQIKTENVTVGTKDKSNEDNIKSVKCKVSDKPIISEKPGLNKIPIKTERVSDVSEKPISGVITQKEMDNRKISSESKISSSVNTNITSSKEINSTPLKTEKPTKSKLIEKLFDSSDEEDLFTDINKSKPKLEKTNVENIPQLRKTSKVHSKIVGVFEDPIFRDDKDKIPTKKIESPKKGEGDVDINREIIDNKKKNMGNQNKILPPDSKTAETQKNVTSQKIVKEENKSPIVVQNKELKQDSKIIREKILDSEDTSTKQSEEDNIFDSQDVSTQRKKSLYEEAASNIALFADEPPVDIFEDSTRSKKPENKRITLFGSDEDEPDFFQNLSISNINNSEISFSSIGLFDNEPPADLDFKSNDKHTKENTLFYESDEELFVPKNEKKIEKINKNAVIASSVTKPKNDNVEDLFVQKNEKKIDIKNKNDGDKPIVSSSSDTKTNEPKITKKLSKLPNLNIDVSKLLPGARAPPSLRKNNNNEVRAAGNSKSASTKLRTDETETENGADGRVTEKTKKEKDRNDDFVDKTETLHNSAVKDRAKIQSKRRPPSRRARVEAARKSMILDEQSDEEDTVDLTQEKLNSPQENSRKPNNFAITQEKLKEKLNLSQQNRLLLHDASAKKRDLDQNSPKKIDSSRENIEENKLGIKENKMDDSHRKETAMSANKVQNLTEEPELNGILSYLPTVQTLPYDTDFNPTLKPNLNLKTTPDRSADNSRSENAPTSLTNNTDILSPSTEEDDIFKIDKIADEDDTLKVDDYNNIFNDSDNSDAGNNSLSDSENDFVRNKNEHRNGATKKIFKNISNNADDLDNKIFDLETKTGDIIKSKKEFNLIEALSAIKNNIEPDDNFVKSGLKRDTKLKLVPENLDITRIESESDVEVIVKDSFYPSILNDTLDGVFTNATMARITMDPEEARRYSGDLVDKLSTLAIDGSAEVIHSAKVGKTSKDRLFDSDLEEDLFTVKPIKLTDNSKGVSQRGDAKPSGMMSDGLYPRRPRRSDNLFSDNEDEEDLFKSRSTKSGKLSKDTKRSNLVTSNLFGDSDDDDDLFKPSSGKLS